VFPVGYGNPEKRSNHIMTEVAWNAGTSTDWSTGSTSGNSDKGGGHGCVCFATGTRILTPTGERLVESLHIGELVVTVADAEQVARPIKWIGHRHIDLMAHPRPDTVGPIRIHRGAFADGIPHSDLRVSPDHAILVAGKLVCARQLINGMTIQQEQKTISVEYFHVELDEHGILLAEGLPTESYLNTGNAGFFANAGEVLTLHPDLTDKSAYLSREAGSVAPFVWDEETVRPIWQRLADRALGLGKSMQRLEFTVDPDLHVLVNERCVRPLHNKDGLFIFAIPRGTTAVRLVSRVSSPTAAKPWLEDRRSLGLYTKRIMLRGMNGVQEIPLDHPALVQGWWAVERDGTTMRRWTDGDATLPLPVMEGPILLEIRASSSSMTYPVSADQRYLAA